MISNKKKRARQNDKSSSFLWTKVAHLSTRGVSPHLVKVYSYNVCTVHMYFLQ